MNDDTLTGGGPPPPAAADDRGRRPPPRLGAIGDELERATRTELRNAWLRRRRIRRRIAGGAVALAILVPGAALATSLLSTDQVERSMPAGTRFLVGTTPHCQVVRDGVEYHCTVEGKLKRPRDRGYEGTSSRPSTGPGTSTAAAVPCAPTGASGSATSAAPRSISRSSAPGSSASTRRRPGWARPVTNPGLLRRGTCNDLALVVMAILIVIDRLLGRGATSSRRSRLPASLPRTRRADLAARARRREPARLGYLATDTGWARARAAAASACSRSPSRRSSGRSSRTRRSRSTPSCARRHSPAAAGRCCALRSSAATRCRRSPSTASAAHHYVRDGHHRASIARATGAFAIDADVVELT